MANGFENLSKMEYPGRVIVIGKSPEGSSIVIYAITGRSPSSQARRFVVEDNEKQILVKPTDEESLKTGNPDLLIYPAIIIENGIAVSNGKHTNDISPLFKAESKPVNVLVNALDKWEYEPDEPIFTPRISGCLHNGAALSIIKRASDGSAEKHYFEISLIPGSGKMIATYTGENVNPLPSFSGEPLDVALRYSSAEDAVSAFYSALGPEEGEDFRVSAAAVYQDKSGKISIAVKNRHGD